MTRPSIEGSSEQVDTEWPGITYEQAKAAHAAGQKIYRAGRTWLVRPVPSKPGQPSVFWIADERTRGDHGFRLYPDSRIEAK